MRIYLWSFWCHDSSSFFLLWKTLLNLLFPTHFPPFPQELSPKMSSSHSSRRPLLIDNYQSSSSLASPCHFCSLYLTCLWRFYRKMGSASVSFSRPSPPLWLNAPVFHTWVFGIHFFPSIFTLLLILFITCPLWTATTATTTKNPQSFMSKSTFKVQTPLPK